MTFGTTFPPLRDQRELALIGRMPADIPVIARDFKAVPKAPIAHVPKPPAAFQPKPAEPITTPAVPSIEDLRLARLATVLGELAAEFPRRDIPLRRVFKIFDHGMPAAAQVGNARALHGLIRRTELLTIQVGGLLHIRQDEMFRALLARWS